MRKSTQQNIEALESHVARAAAARPVKHLIAGREKIRRKAMKTACPYQDTTFHEVERQTFDTARRRLGVSHAEIMAYQLSIELAHNGEWNEAWECVRTFYSMPRSRWEALIRGVLLRKIKHEDCLIPI